MTTMKNKFYFLAAALLGFLTFSAPVKAASFLEGYEDIPVMRGLRQIPSDTISFGNEETRVLNANNKLVQYVAAHKDSEHVPMICEQLYDLAMLAHKTLNPDEMTKFIARSNEILMLLAMS